MNKRRQLLLILDGVGLGPPDAANALHLAHTPHLDRLFATRPWCRLAAHGTAVGMPGDGDMGNSEVGHNAMGAGRVFDQGAKRVDEALRADAGPDSLFLGEPWAEILAAGRQGTLHLLGLLSDGNVHSHVRHLKRLIEGAVEGGIQRIRVHTLTDGRDVAPRSALRFLAPLEEKLAGLGAQGVDARIASGGGRMHLTMDRYEADWEMVERGWRCHVEGEGRLFPSASEAVATFYAEDPQRDDQWLPAFRVHDREAIRDGDAVVLFNFRGDRAIEIARAFCEGPTFAGFTRTLCPQVCFAGIMQYDGDLQIPPRYLVSPPRIAGTVGERFAAAGLRTFACAETQKFGHVTYFFNGNRSDAPKGEERLEIPSLNLPFDQAPAMRAREVTEAALAALARPELDLIRINLANGDMVGHTGSLPAAIAAMEVVDECVGRLLDAAAAAGVVSLVTADHGNVEEMAQRDKKTGVPLLQDGRLITSTAHSLNPVPFILVDPTNELRLAAPAQSQAGGIARIGGTLLTLAGLVVPADWEPSLVNAATAPHDQAKTE